LATPLWGVAKKLFIWERKLIIELSDMSLFNGRLGSVMLEIGISTRLALLITRDDGNNYLRHLDTAVCGLLTTSANSSKKAVFTLGNPCSIR
jgi:hypothetical protein